MKKFLFLTAAFFTITSSFAQEGRTAPTIACSTDCLIGECRIKCPASAVPACTCIIGLFSSCKCLENVMSRVSPSEYDLIVRKDDAKIKSVTTYLTNKGDKGFSTAINGAYTALKANNAKDYESHLTTLENLVKTNPNLAAEIHKYVQTLK